MHQFEEDRASVKTTGGMGNPSNMNTIAAADTRSEYSGIRGGGRGKSGATS